MTNVYDLYHDISESVANFIQENMNKTNAETCGLDDRAAYELYVNEDCIAIHESDDRSLQYYGGFEYVDKRHRAEMGDYVFYFAEDERVERHIDTYYEKLDAHVDEMAEQAA